MRNKKGKDRVRKKDSMGIRIFNRVVVAAAIAAMVGLKLVDLIGSVLISIAIGLVIGLILFVSGETFIKIGITLITLASISLYAAHGHGNAARSRDRPGNVHVRKVHHLSQQSDRCHGKTR